MKIKATIRIDDDRFAKHPYDVMFDDEECNKKCSIYNLDSRNQCMEAQLFLIFSLSSYSHSCFRFL